MKRAIFAMFILATLFASEAYSQLVAEQITRENAPQRLFSGSDPAGGIGDWYLSNGIVEAIIDNAALNADVRVPIQNGVAPTGGTLIDAGLVGRNNDQFNQMFQVVNISPANSFFYTSISAAVTPQAATVTATGFVLFGSVSTITNPTLQAQTVYSLAPGDRFITIRSTISNTTNMPQGIFNITDAITWTIHGLFPFSPAPSRGFNHPRLSLTPAGITDAIGLFPFVIAPGVIGPENGMADTLTGSVCGEASYGIVPRTLEVDPDGPMGPMAPVVTPLQALLGINSALVSGIGNPFDPTRSPMLPPGATFTYTRRLFVSDRNDVASISNGLYSSIFPANAVGTLNGDIDADDVADIQASLIFEGKLTPLFGDAIVPVTQTLTDATGKFSVTLPAGEYRVRITSPERNDLTETSVVVAPGTTTTANLRKMSATGSVSFRVTERGAPVPAKLTFVGVEGTPNPNFSRFYDALIMDRQGNVVGDEEASSVKGSPLMNFIFSNGSGKQVIKPGRYQVIASRGTEYTIGMRTITVTAGQEVNLDFALERVVDTTGFVSADFHVHSMKSPDASAPLEDRILSFIAENVETIVSTEHNYIVDYAPVIKKLGMERFATTITGEEITTSLPNPIFPDGFGHHNIFPLNVQPNAPRRGAVNSEFVPAATFYDRARMQDTGILNDPNDREVIQLNHARAGLMGIGGLTSGGVFTTVRFNPTRPIAVPPNGQLLVQSQLGTGTRNIDFDAMELYNGNDIGFYQALRNDWFSLLNQGFIKTATAVSDSHRLVVDAPGFPRTYVAAPTDDPTALKEDMVTDAILARNVLGTSGPFIRFNVNGQGLGSLVKKRQGKVTLNIVVSAPAWVPVEEVRILNNGKVVMTFNATTNPRVTPAPADPTSNQGVERFRATIKIKPPKKDSYFTVEAGTRLPAVADTNNDGVPDRGDTNGDGRIDTNDRGFVQPPSPPIYAAIAPGFVPLAFTNPIFIDRNGNDRFDAPGLEMTTTAQPEEEVAEQPTELENNSGEFYNGLKIDMNELQRFIDSLSGPERQFTQPLREMEEIRDQLNKLIPALSLWASR